MMPSLFRVCVFRVGVSQRSSPLALTAGCQSPEPTFVTLDAVPPTSPRPKRSRRPSRWERWTCRPRWIARASSSVTVRVAWRSIPRCGGPPRSKSWCAALRNNLADRLPAEAVDRTVAAARRDRRERAHRRLRDVLGRCRGRRGARRDVASAESRRRIAAHPQRIARDEGEKPIAARHRPGDERSVGGLADRMVQAFAKQRHRSRDALRSPRATSCHARHAQVRGLLCSTRQSARQDSNLRPQL